MCCQARAGESAEITQVWIRLKILLLDQQAQHQCILTGEVNRVGEIPPPIS